MAYHKMLLQFWRQYFFLYCCNDKKHILLQEWQRKYIYPLARILWYTFLSNGCTNIYTSQIYTQIFHTLLLNLHNM